MKVVMIHGQNHKGSTYHIGRLLLEKVQGEKEVKEFFLPRDLNHFCTGCYACITDDRKCPFYEEKSKIMEAVEHADLLIFTTPTYCMGASASLKALFDLTFTYWMVHRPRACMFHKKAVVISTAAGSGARKAVKDVANMLFYMGVPWVKRYGISVQAMNWESVSAKRKEKIKKELTSLAAKLDRAGTPKAGIKTRAVFSLMRKMQQGGMGSSPVEMRYWSAQGWLDKKRPWKDCAE